MTRSNLPLAERLFAVLVLTGLGYFIGGLWIAGLAFIAGLVAIGCGKAAAEMDDAEGRADDDGMPRSDFHSNYED